MDDITQLELLKHFPHESFRPGQKEVICNIVDAFNSGIDNVMVEMPTGGGKSSIAFTIGKFIGDSYVVTPQKILQDQYTKDIESLKIDAVTLKGKGNYKCIEQTDKMCDECICSVGKKCETYSNSDCVYYNKETDALLSDMAIVNFHILRAIDMKLFKRANNPIEYNKLFRRAVLIIDEAHTLEDFLMDLISVKIPVFEDYLESPLPKVNKRGEVSIGLIDNICSAAIRKYTAMINSIMLDIENGDTRNIKQINSLQRKTDKLNHLLNNITNNNWAFIKDFEEGEFIGVTCKPISVAHYSSLILRCGFKRLYLSATLPNKEVFCRSLGINPKNTFTFTTENNFHVDRRKIYCLSDRNENDNFYGITHRNITNMGENAVYGPLLKLLFNIINSEYCKDKKGLIITHNNNILKKILNESNFDTMKRMIVCSSSHETTEEGIIDKRLHAINEHTNNDEPTILIGPWLYEGLDLKYDLARFVIIFKCPYPYEDQQVKLKRNQDPDWYSNSIALKLIQGCGRGTRAENDFCMNFIIDPSATQFIYGRGNKFFPKYINEALSPIPNTFFRGEDK